MELASLHMTNFGFDRWCTLTGGQPPHELEHVNSSIAKRKTSVFGPAFFASNCVLKIANLRSYVVLWAIICM